MGHILPPANNNLSSFTETIQYFNGSTDSFLIPITIKLVDTKSITLKKTVVSIQMKLADVNALPKPLLCVIILIKITKYIPITSPGMRKLSVLPLKADGVSGLGSSVLGDINNSVADMRSATDAQEEDSATLIGSFSNLGGILSGAATIIRIIFLSPLLISSTLQTLLISLQVPMIIVGLIMHPYYP